jgi:hypothetical protein
MLHGCRINGASISSPLFSTQLSTAIIAFMTAKRSAEPFGKVTFREQLRAIKDLAALEAALDARFIDHVAAVLAQNSELPRKFRDFGATALSSPA